MITNQMSEITLKSIRSFDNNEFFSNEDLGELAVQVKIISDCLEEKLEIIKAELLKRKIENIQYPEYEKKVYLSEGKSSVNYDVKAIYEIMKKMKKIDNFLEIVSISKSKADLQDVNIKEAVILNSTIKEGSPYVTIAKMNKAELLESKKK